MIFAFGAFSVDVDVERTRKYYAESARTLTEGCDCIACQNFVKAYQNIDPRIRDFFDSLGVDPRKAPDMSAMHGDAKTNMMYYLGWCHLCGTVISGESAWVPDSDRSCHWEEERAFAVTETCRVSVNNQCALVDDSFPRPVLQLEVDIQVPWVLEDAQHAWMV